MSDPAVIEPMYDAAGRKYGPRGVLISVRAQLLAAHKDKVPDPAQIDLLRRKLALAEKSWQDWCVKTGYSPEEAVQREKDLGLSRELARYERPSS